MIPGKIKESGYYSKIKILFLWIAAAFLFIYLIYFTIINSGKDTHGFASYYTASKLFLEGESVYRYYDDNFFSEKVKNYVPAVYELYYINTPISFFVILPFSVFDFNAAKSLWIIFSLLILATTVGLILIKLKYEIQKSLLVVILILCFQPLYANILYGQVYIFIFCLLVAAWSAYRSGNDKILGIVLGFIIVIKLAGLVLLVLLAVQKKWQSLLWTFITIVLLAAISIPFVGIDSWFVFKENLIKYYSSPTLSVTAYQTIHSFFYHFTFFDQKWNPVPLIDFPLLGKMLTYFSYTIVFVSISYFAYKIKNSDLSFGLFVIAGIILSPASIDYHYFMILISFIIILNYIQLIKSGWIYISLFFSYLLIAVSIPYTSAKVSNGLLAVFAYPKLYGAIGLLILFLIIGIQLFKNQNYSKAMESSSKFN